MAATLRSLVSALEDDPYCGTRPPHWPGGPLRPGSIEELYATRATGKFGPSPEPWLTRDAAAVVYQQVRLFQLGHALQTQGGPAAGLGSTMSGYASEVFEDWCGTVPLSVLIAQLLHHNPPPPPPWWLEDITQVVSQLTLAARMEGPVGGAIQHAGIGRLKEQLAALPAVQRPQQFG